MTESQAREDLTRFAKSLFDRGYSVGSSGNISVAVEDGLLITPTNSCLGFLDPARIAKLDRAGRHVGGDKPSKEIFLHQAFYDTRPGTGAVVHLHSTYATAVSCLADTDPEDAIPPLTPYVVMRVGRVKLLPYVRPGDPRMGEMIRDLAGSHAAVLLANHGPAVAAADLATAVFAAEELEETAKLVTLLKDRPTRHLDAAQVQELVRVFGAGR
ncbi:3-oxo-tetronate 4-phosphate decarboxylase [Methylobacterium oryzisoli]|uniref:3-oxo-tetronate 4-phosphate decarboxylase n=1 Tax=Methylobacterium oryzisoli TaxID=3385502 RepID=UPI003892CA13